MRSNFDQSFLTCGRPYPRICTEIGLDFTPQQALLFPEQVLQVLGLVSGQTRRLVSAAPPAIGLEVAHPSLLLVRPLPGPLHPSRTEESLLSQDRTNRSAPKSDDTSRTVSPAASQSFTRNGQVLTELQAFLACLTLVSLVSHICASKD